MDLPLNQLKHESVQERDKIADYLDAISQGIRKGEVVFHHGENDITLNPADQVSLEVEVKKSDTKNRIKFKFSWQQLGSEAAEKLVIE